MVRNCVEFQNVAEIGLPVGPRPFFWHRRLAIDRSRRPGALVKSPRDRSLLICAQYMSEGSGGIAEVARMTAKSLGRRHPTRALACLDRSDFTFERVPVRAFRGNRLRFVASLALAAPRATHVVHDFAGTARAGRFQLGPSRPEAVWAHGIEVWDEPRSSRLRALRRAALVLVNSNYTRERSARALDGLGRARICLLGTLSDDGPESVGPSEGPPTVLVLGRIDPGLPKGHDLLISIWPKVVSAVPEARLLIAGGGGGLVSARDLAATSPARGSIDILGFVPGAEIEALWRRATVMAMPSRKEGFGIVYVEAMRRGVPAIASTEDAGQEINLDGVTGFNLSRARPDRMAEVIIALMRDPDLAARLGAAGHRRWREQFCFSQFDRRLQGAMAEFLAS
jgi:phosphatidylinositol alpha-1,6-mannosyltransferase